MHVESQWVNMHLLPPLIDKKQGEPKMTLRLTALVKRVAKLRDASLRVCHYADEFTRLWILPLGHRKKLAYECPRLVDLSRELAFGKIFSVFTFYYR
jgi:hypothetical protein